MKKRRFLLQKGPRHIAIDELSLLSRYELIVYIIIFLLFGFLLYRINKIPVRKIEIAVDIDSVSDTSVSTKALIDCFLPVSPVETATMVDTGSFLSPYKKTYNELYYSNKGGGIRAVVSENVVRGQLSIMTSIVSILPAMYFHETRKVGQSDVIYSTRSIKAIYNVPDTTIAYNIKKSWPFYTSLTRPTMWSLYDISQSYYEISVKGQAIDTVLLALHFKGAVEVDDIIGAANRMDDLHTVYHIEPQNNEKKILLHVKHKDLENSQQIRFFGVTSVLAALITMFLAFLIIYVYRFRHKELDEN